MPIRDATPGDVDALDALAASMAASNWRCDVGVDRPARVQIEAWIGGLHGRHVFVLTAANGSVIGGMVHSGAQGKWWIIDQSGQFLSRLVQLCQAVFDAHGDCWGRVNNPTSRTTLRGAPQFLVGDDGLVRFRP